MSWRVTGVAVDRLGFSADTRLYSVFEANAISVGPSFVVITIFDESIAVTSPANITGFAVFSGVWAMLNDNRPLTSSISTEKIGRFMVILG
jgi:hypothetical protein